MRVTNDQIERARCAISWSSFSSEASTAANGASVVPAREKRLLVFGTRPVLGAPPQAGVSASPVQSRGRQRHRLCPVARWA
jgi:hypothetical protein